MLVDDLVHVVTDDIMTLPVYMHISQAVTSANPQHTDNSTRASEATRRRCKLDPSITRTPPKGTKHIRLKMPTPNSRITPF